MQRIVNEEHAAMVGLMIVIDGKTYTQQIFMKDPTTVGADDDSTKKAVDNYFAGCYVGQKLAILLERNFDSQIRGLIADEKARLRFPVTITE